MQPFQSSKYLLEQGAVNWYEPLADQIAKRNKDLEKSVAEKEAQTAKQLKVLKEEDPILKLAAVSKTIAAAGKLLKQTKAGKNKKELEEKNEAIAFIKRHPIIGKEFSTLYKQDKNLRFSEENKTYKDWKTTLIGRDDGHIYKPLFQELESLSGRRQTALKEAVAIRHAQEISGSTYFETVGLNSTHMVDGEEVPLYTKDEIDQYRNSKDKATWQQEFVAGELAKMGYEPKFVQKFMAGELNRRLSTSRNIQNAINSKTYNESTVSVLNGLLETNLSSVDGGDWIETFVNQSIEGASNFQDIEIDGKKVTALQQSADEVFQRFQKLNGAGFVPQLALSELNAYEFDHPAGPGGKGNLLNTLFGGDADKLHQIISTNNQGQKYYLGTQTANDLTELQQLKLIANQGGDITDRLNILESRGLVKKEEINNVRRIDVSAQTEEAFNNTMEIWTPKLEIGLQGVDHEEIKAIPNKKARDLIQARFNQLKAAESTVGDQVGNMDNIIHGSYSKLPWVTGQSTLTPTALLIKRDIDHAGSAYRARLIWSQYDDSGKLVNKIDDIDYQVTQYKKGLWASGGGGKRGGDGIYALDKNGDNFSNYERAMEMKQKIGKEMKYANDGSRENMKSVLISNLEKYRTLGGDTAVVKRIDYDAFVADGVLGQTEILEWLHNGGKTSDWVEYVSGFTGIPVSTIIQQSMAKIAKDDPAFARLWQLDKLSKNMPEQGVMDRFNQRFTELNGTPTIPYATASLEVLNARDMKFLLTKGIKNLSSNQLNRLMATLNVQDLDEFYLRSDALDDRVGFNTAELVANNRKADTIQAYQKVRAAHPDWSQQKIIEYLKQEGEKRKLIEQGLIPTTANDPLNTDVG